MPHRAVAKESPTKVHAHTTSTKPHVLRAQRQVTCATGPTAFEPGVISQCHEPPEYEHPPGAHPTLRTRRNRAVRGSNEFGGRVRGAAPTDGNLEIQSDGIVDPTAEPKSSCPTRSVLRTVASSCSNGCPRPPSSFGENQPSTN